MQSPNEVTGIVLIFMFSLCAWALRHSRWRNPQVSGDWFIRAIVISAVLVLFQRTYWDVYTGITAWVHPALYDVLRFWGNWMNSFVNLGLSYAAWCALKGRWLLIDPAERDHFGPITSAFYPRRLKLWMIRKGKA